MKRHAVWALAVVAAAGCNSGGASDEEPLPTDGVTAEQVQAFRRLEATSKLSWRWMQHEQFKTPMHLSAPRRGTPALVAGADAVKATLSVLADNRALFKMRDPSSEFAVEHADVDDLGMTHARFQQLTHGVPVAGAEVMAHYDRDGHLASIDANYVPDLDRVDVNPTLVPAEALARVTSDILAHSVVDASELRPNEGKLVVYVPSEKPASARLAYQFKVRALAAKKPAIWVVTVDAKTGDILERYDNFQTLQAEGVGVLGDRKQFEVTENGDGYIMTDSSGDVQLRTYDALSKLEDSFVTSVTSDDPMSWDTGPRGPGAAVDAHFYAGVVLKYYKEKHNRNAIDGKGGALLSSVHFGENFDNAGWDGFGMVYGDGGDYFRPLSVGLDVAAHEFTHGVTERTSGLVYKNQPGALNEAVSDIFAAFIEHAAKPDESKNWLIGEDVVKSGKPLRDMKNPSKVSQPQPAHMNKFVNTQQDQGGVHINSGIVNNAALLMTVGGTNPTSKIAIDKGIGWEKSEKLWYRATTKYFMQNTNFGQAAQGVLQAAKDVGLTQADINIVDCSFKATGIAQGECASLAPEATDEVDPTDGEEGDPTAETPRRRRAITTTTEGCNATGSSDFSTAALVFLAVVGLAGKRRKR